MATAAPTAKFISLACKASRETRRAHALENKDSVITEVDGGGEAGEECRRLFKEVPESNRLIEIMFGYHPEASAEHGIADPMHWELISKMPWAGLGTPRKHPNFRHIDGSVFNEPLHRRSPGRRQTRHARPLSAAHPEVLDVRPSLAIRTKCSRRSRTRRMARDQLGNSTNPFRSGMTRHRKLTPEWSKRDEFRSRLVLPIEAFGNDRLSKGWE